MSPKLAALAFASVWAAAAAHSSRSTLRSQAPISLLASPTAEASPPSVGGFDEADEAWDLFGERPIPQPISAAEEAPSRLGLKDRRVLLGPPNKQYQLHHVNGVSPDRSSCKPLPPLGFALVGIYLSVWTLLAIAVWIRNHLARRALKAPELELLPTVQERDPRWDRVRFHLMTIIIWTHWVGKWGMEKTKAGWIVLNWAFAIHVVSFVFLSGVFSARYAEKVQARGLRESVRVIWNCLDVFLVYLIFSWLRGLVSLTMMQPDLGPAGIVTEMFRGTFLFHQAPWYLSALIVWRLSVFLLWRVPGVLVVSLCIGAFCPYEALHAVRDPFAVREVMHYLPFFTLGLLCGQEKLEQLVTACGKRLTPLVGALVLLLLALVISCPLGYLFHDKRLRWVLLKKDVPPLDVGGYWLMLLLYAVKAISMIAALMLFIAPTNSVLDRMIETAGTRSMMVYMVHMVFVMVPGEFLCPATFVRTETGVLSILVLFVLAFAVNLLCGSDFTASVFQPLMEPLSTIRGVHTKVKKWVE